MISKVQKKGNYLIRLNEKTILSFNNIFFIFQMEKIENDFSLYTKEKIQDKVNIIIINENFWGKKE